MTRDQTFSHFRIGKPLGSGGTGSVYRAEDLSLHRPVALKFLLEEPGADARQLARFLREARTVAALNHPNICTIHEVGEVEKETAVTHPGGRIRIPPGSPFLSMELIEGSTLREMLDRSPRLPLPELLDIAVQIADGFAEAHSCKIVHRDLKPGNVMVTPAGRVKILDFGLAKPVEPLRSTEVLSGTETISAEPTLSGQVLGTFSHMSPEQAEGRRVDHRSDVFAFGTLLYEMATGRNPFAADSPAATMAKILEAAPEPLSKLRAELPRRLGQIVERCLQKKPEDRYAETGELARELRELQDAVRAGKLRRGPSWLPSKRVLSLATVAFLTVFAAIIVYRTGTDDGGAPESAVPSANRVAVFPFTVQGADRFAYLSEGMVDLLGALVDGAGEMRSVDPFALRGKMKSEGVQVPDAESGRSLAARLDAGLYVLGDIVEANGHLQATCSLYEIDGGPPTVARASIDDESQLYALVENLARQLLVDRRDDVELGIDLAAETTGSIDALKEYLRGERFRREGEIDDAIDAYRRAVEKDSTFALAWYALSFACAHTFKTELGREASARAMGLREALPSRERYLVEAQDAWSRAAFEETERLYRAALEIDPHCAKAWYGLGENLLHSAHLRGRPPEEAHQLMERARQEGTPQDHPTTVSMFHWAAGMAGQREEVVKWTHRGIELGWDDGALEIAFLEGDEHAWERTCANLVETKWRADDMNVYIVAHAPLVVLQAWVDSRLLGAVQQFLRAALESGGRPSGTRAAFHINVAHLELAQGRPAAASAEFDRARALDPAATLEHEALLAVGPVVAATPEELQQLRERLRIWDADSVEPSIEPNPFICPHDACHPELRLYLLGLLSSRLGDFEAASRYAEELDHSAETPDEIAAAAALSGSIRAHLAVAQGDSATALDELRNMTFGPRWELAGASPFFSRSLDRFLLAELLDAQGRPEEALLWFGGVPYQDANDFAYLALCYRRRGEILERLGRIEEARQHYSRFLDLWQNCDPEYQSQVDEVRQRVEALTGT